VLKIHPNYPILSVPLLGLFNMFGAEPPAPVSIILHLPKVEPIDII